MRTELFCLVLLHIEGLRCRAWLSRWRVGGEDSRGQRAISSCRECGDFCTAGRPQMVRITFPGVVPVKKQKAFIFLYNWRLILVADGREPIS